MWTKTPQFGRQRKGRAQNPRRGTIDARAAGTGRAQTKRGSSYVTFRENAMKFFAIAGVAVSALFAASLSTPADAQQWPARQVRLIVPYPAGGNVDSAARVIADRLQAKLGQPFIVENKAGAGGLIA